MGAEQIERLAPLLEGKRIGMIVNHTSIVRTTAGSHIHLVDTLLSRGIMIKTIFAPEHGFRGSADAGATIHNSTDTKTHLPIISLYGKNKKPTPAQLRDIDILIFDIQDVGARFYTYINTMGYAMEAAAEQGKQMIILDRPNPNDVVAGPILDMRFKSFVGMYPIPILHGLTVGELAQMINGEGWLANNAKCDLHIITLEGWSHGQPYTLPLAPSPNLPNAQSVWLYASLCPFEGTEVSVGRGTTLPFQCYGSPNYKTPAGSPQPYHFIPRPSQGNSAPFQNGTQCFGKDLSQLNQDAPYFSLHHIFDAYNHCGRRNGFFQFSRMFDLLLGSDRTRKAMLDGATQAEIEAQWTAPLNHYNTLRSRYILYKETPVN